MTSIKDCSLNKGSNVYKFVIFLLFFGLFALNIGSTFSTSNMPFLMILCIAFFMAMLHIIRSKGNIIVIKPIYYYAIFVIVAFSSYMWAKNKNSAFSGALVVLLTLIIIVTFKNLLLASKLNIIDVFELIFLAGLFTFLYLVARYGIGVAWRLRDPSFPASEYYNANGMGRTYLISAICGWIAVTKGKKNSVYKLFSGVLLLLALLSGSKTNILFLAIFASIVLYLNNKSNKNAVLVLCIPLMLIFGYYLIMDVPLLYNVVGYRFSELSDAINGDVEKYSSTWYRLEMMKKGLQLFKDNPLIGYGMANAAEYNRFEWAYESGVYLHSNILELLVDIGIIGTIPYYAIYYSSLKMNMIRFKTGDQISKYFIAFIISYSLTDISSVSYFNRSIILIIILGSIYASGLLELSDREERRE